jgi:hypothetical protein
MSWDDYVGYLKAGQSCKDGFILDLNARVLASSYNLKINDELPSYELLVLD